MTYTLGCDISRWQGAVNFGTMAAAGAKFCYIRAGSAVYDTGRLYRDERWEENSVNAPPHLICGAYWYFRPQWSATAQADFMANLAASKELYLPLWLDCESTGGLNAAAVAAAIQTFVQRYFAQTGQVAAIYTRGIWWNDNVGNPAFAADLDLAVARYNEYVNHPWNDAPNLRPLPWNDFKFWQWSADGNMRGAEFGAESNSIDLDWFNGGYDDLLSYAGLEPENELETRVTELEAQVADLYAVLDQVRQALVIT